MHVDRLATAAAFAGLLWVVSASGLRADDTPSAEHASRPPAYSRDIRPILKAHCYHCHGEDGEVEGGIDLRQVRLMRQTGALADESLGDSPLLEQIRSGAMPKNAKPLPAAEQELIAAWVLAGAQADRVESEQVPSFEITDAEREHWAYRPIEAAPVPQVGELHPIDAFIREQLITAGLDFAPAADRVTLLRRASFDLLGLPPTPEQLAEFVNDPSATAWESAIDRLLASPQYGERWGRHWLDVVGYADSNGGPRDSLRQNAWHYRDYVVRAHNTDKPWDIFIQEQLAGDELARATHETAAEVLRDPAEWDRLIATGFWRMGPDITADDPPDAAVAREAVIADSLKVFGSAFLGLTVGCAQCHDHRFDPISHVDYFRLRALIQPVYDTENWRNHDLRDYPAYTAEEIAENARLEAEAAAVDKTRTDLIDREYNKYLEERMADLADELKDAIRVAWHKPQGERTEAEQALLVEHKCDFSKADHLRFLPNRDTEERERVQLVEQAKEIRGRQLVRQIMTATEIRDHVPATHRLHRGDHRQPREVVAPGDLTIFEQAPAISPADPDQYSSGRRLAYARWLTSGRHPMATRILVNRFWFHHMGKGLATPLADFGLRTARPKHAELLDWLATRFVESGWSLKQFHRLVMTSRTYQQGNHNPAAERIDGDNDFFARNLLKRLEAEAVRDALLAVTGNLETEVGGPPLVVARNPAGGVVLGKEVLNVSNGVVEQIIPLGAAANRRSLYVQQRRERPLTVLQTFDLPMMTPNCNQRAITTVAPQSLMMLNDGFVVSQSELLARRLLAEFPDSPSVRITTLWRRAYGEQPTDDELAAALGLIDAERSRQLAVETETMAAEERALSALCQVIFASNQFLYAP